MKVNVIIVYNKTEDKVLMCLRSKEPYKGLYNLVGGRVENKEKGITSAYRELKEETNITRKDIKLNHLMDFKYYMSHIMLQVYVGKLNKEVQLIEEENKLYWIDLTENFSDNKKYAGEGNIYHMLEQVKIYEERLIDNKTKIK